MGLFPEKIKPVDIKAANRDKKIEEDRRKPEEEYPELTPEQIENNRKRLREIKEGAMKIGSISR